MSVYLIYQYTAHEVYKKIRQLNFFNLESAFLSVHFVGILWKIVILYQSVVS